MTGFSFAKIASRMEADQFLIGDRNQQKKNNTTQEELTPFADSEPVVYEG